MGKPHALAIPYPAQGHVIPLMELCHCLIDHGIKITFVNTDFIHARVLAALPKIQREQSPIHLVSIPDGLAPEEDRNHLGKLSESILSYMPGYLEDLICKINESDDDKITCVLADATMSWALQVAEKMGIRSAVFWPAAVGLMALCFSISDLIDTGVIHANGLPTKQQRIKLSQTMPEVDSNQLPWMTFGEHASPESIFSFINYVTQITKSADCIVCNSFYEIEQSAFKLVPKAMPIGPLLAGNRFGRLEGNLWPEDSTCLSWLDKQPICSVIYVAFGSFTVFDPRQFHELALGLELSGRPFLWVVRPDLTNGSSEAYPDGFEARVADRGQMVGWSPQQKVLAHPSIACFLSHCGWNSTLEGLSNGVPFLCWPYFADQFYNQSYISDFWKVGFELKRDCDGIITRQEIKERIDTLLGDKAIRARSLKLREMARKSVAAGGSSLKNFIDFIEAMK